MSYEKAMKFSRNPKKESRSPWASLRLDQMSAERSLGSAERGLPLGWMKSDGSTSRHITQKQSGCLEKTRIYDW